MKYEEREQIFNEIFDFCKNTFKSKGVDYSGEEDVISNFKRSAAKYGITPEQALGILMDKHNQAIERYIQGKELMGEPVENKILDNINYLGLLLCIIKEKQNKPKPTLV